MREIVVYFGLQRKVRQNVIVTFHFKVDSLQCIVMLAYIIEVTIATGYVKLCTTTDVV